LPDKIMAAASSLDAWLPLLVLVILATWWKGGFRARSFLLTVGIIVAVNDGVVANALKHLVDRPRPTSRTTMCGSSTWPRRVRGVWRFSNRCR